MRILLAAFLGILGVSIASAQSVAPNLAIKIEKLPPASTPGPNDLFILHQVIGPGPSYRTSKMTLSQIIASGGAGNLGVYSGQNIIGPQPLGTGVLGALAVAPNTGGGMALYPVPASSLSGLGSGVAAALAAAANATGGIATSPVAVSTLSGLGTGVAAALADNVGSAGAPVVYGGDAGTPSSVTLTNGVGLPISTGVVGLGSGVGAALQNTLNAASGLVALNASGFTPSSPKIGTINGSAVAAGNIGQIQSSDVPIGSAVAMTGGITADVTSILVPAGIWQCWGTVVTSPAGSTITTSMGAWLGTTSVTPPTAIENGGAFAQIAGITTGAGNRLALSVGTLYIDTASPLNLYLSSFVNFSASTLGAYGYEACRRVA